MLELYILGELPPDEAARIEAMLNEDPDTRHRLQSAKRMVEALDRSLAEPKARPDLAEQIIARLPSERSQTSATWSTRRRWSNWRQLIQKAEKLMKEPETMKLFKELQAQYGEDRDGFMKAWMKAMTPFTRSLRSSTCRAGMSLGGRWSV